MARVICGAYVVTLMLLLCVLLAPLKVASSANGVSGNCRGELVMRSSNIATNGVSADVRFVESGVIGNRRRTVVCFRKCWRQFCVRNSRSESSVAVEPMI